MTEKEIRATIDTLCAELDEQAKRALQVGRRGVAPVVVGAGLMVGVACSAYGVPDPDPGTTSSSSSSAGVAGTGGTTGTTGTTGSQGGSGGAATGGSTGSNGSGGMPYPPYMAPCPTV